VSVMNTVRSAKFVWSAVGVVSLLAACAGSPPVSYYTLQEAAGSARDSAAPLRLAGDRTVIEVLPVSVPAQVDQPQIMLRDAAGAVTPRYSDRWAAPLGDELRSALSNRLTRRLDVADVYQVKPARGQPVWRVQMDVQRFDSILGEAAIIEATWRLRAVNMQAPAMLCRTSVRQDVTGSDVAAGVTAHQRALRTLGDLVAARMAGGDPTLPEGVAQQCSVVSEEPATPK